MSQIRHFNIWGVYVLGGVQGVSVLVVSVQGYMSGGVLSCHYLPHTPPNHAQVPCALS